MGCGTETLVDGGDEAADGAGRYERGNVQEEGAGGAKVPSHQRNAAAQLSRPGLRRQTQTRERAAMHCGWPGSPTFVEGKKEGNNNVVRRSATAFESSESCRSSNSIVQMSNDFIERNDDTTSNKSTNAERTRSLRSCKQLHIFGRSCLS